MLFNFQMPWITWNTWNDFPEGTFIEPGASNDSGYGYDALEVAQSSAISFKSLDSSKTNNASSLRLPHMLFESRTAGSSVAETATNMILGRQFESAETCLADDRQARGSLLGWVEIANKTSGIDVSFSLDLAVCRFIMTNRSISRLLDELRM
jgi:hypothetical protein